MQPIHRRKLVLKMAPAENREFDFPTPGPYSRKKQIIAVLTTVINMCYEFTYINIDMINCFRIIYFTFKFFLFQGGGGEGTI